MKSLDKAAASRKMHRSAHSVSPGAILKSRNKDRIVLNKSQNLVTFDEKKPIEKDEHQNLMQQLDNLKEAVKLVKNKGK